MLLYLNIYQNAALFTVLTDSLLNRMVFFQRFIHLEIEASSKDADYVLVNFTECGGSNFSDKMLIFWLFTHV